MSALYELALALNYSVIDSVLCHRRSHLLFNFQVTGDGRGLREFRRQPFGSRPQDTDYRWPKRRFLMAWFPDGCHLSPERF